MEERRRMGGERNSGQVKREEEEKRKGRRWIEEREKTGMNKRKSIPTLRQLVPPADNSNCEYLYVCVRVCVCEEEGCSLSELLSKSALVCVCVCVCACVCPCPCGGVRCILCDNASFRLWACALLVCDVCVSHIYSWAVLGSTYLNISEAIPKR